MNLSKLSVCVNFFFNTRGEFFRNASSSAERTKLLLSKMSKRKKIEMKSSTNSNYIYLQMLGSGAEGSTRSLFLHLGNRSVLFNCAEGTFRATRDAINKGNPHHVFITNDAWQNVAGITGLRQNQTLINHSGECGSLSTYGPGGISAMWNNFSQLDNAFVPLKHHPVCKISFLIEDILTVQPIPIYSKEKNGIDGNELNKEVSTVAYICKIYEKAGSIDLRLLVEADVPPGQMVASLKAGNSVKLPNGKIVNYSDVSKPFLGSIFFVIEIPTLNYLQSLIENVHFFKYQTSSRGSMENINYEPIEGSINDDNVCNPDVIVHFSPAHVIKDPQYINWINSFSCKTSHILINEDNYSIGIDRLNGQQVLMNHLYPKSFPLLKTHLHFVNQELHSNDIHSNGANINNKVVNVCNEKVLWRNINNNCEIEDMGCETIIDNKNIEKSDKLYRDSYFEIHKHAKLSFFDKCGIIANAYHADSSYRFHLRPTKQICASKSPIDDFHWILKHYYKDADFVQSLAEMKEKFKQMNNGKGIEGDENSTVTRYPQVTFLGTGSAISNTKRNISGILLSSSPSSNIFLDAGESTFGQLVKLEGIKIAREILLNTKAIFVSHHHCDHHLGILTLILERRKAFEAKNIKLSKLYILGPPLIFPYLKAFHTNYMPILHDLICVNNMTLIKNKNCFSTTVYNQICQHLDMCEILITFVPHCKDSFAISLKHNSGSKVVYSGDTQPTEYLVQIGQNCDLLIHEATFADILKKDAREKFHSTISQAIDIGNEMKAKNIILTHFSQRYSTLPIVENDLPNNVSLAFDFMKVSLDDLRYLPHLYPVLKSLFREEYDTEFNKIYRKRIAPQFKWKRAAYELDH